MHRILKNTQRGFTLIELMIVVAIIGILAAVAIPQFLKMMAKSKTGEAQLSLDLIKKSNKAQWAETTGFILAAPTGAPTTGNNGNGCCDNPDRKCTFDAADWDDEWAKLDFKVDQAGYFFYEYEATAETLLATATGDLDCNGDPGVWTLAGAIDTDGGPLWTLTKPLPNVN